MTTFNWNDISTESYREYVTAAGEAYRINAPVGHYISASGTHYVKDSDGVVHAIQRSAFMAVRWFDKDRGVLYVNPSNPDGPLMVEASLA